MRFWNSPLGVVSSELPFRTGPPSRFAFTALTAPRSARTSEPGQSVRLGDRLRSGREGRASGDRPLRANSGRCHPRRWPHPQSQAGAGGPSLAVPEVCSGYRYARRTRSSSTRCEAAACGRSRTPSRLGSGERPRAKPCPGSSSGTGEADVHPDPGCPNAASISPGNRMPFNSAEEAERDRVPRGKGLSSSVKQTAPWASLVSLLPDLARFTYGLLARIIL